MAVDADTKKCLEESKKGKPRRFVMICKGIKIVSMIVFKKGSLEKYKKQAKEEGKGQFYHGVVSGGGLEIVFNLLRSDGFESPPGKELILKDFLKTEAEMNFKPVYMIVDELPAVPNDEEEVGAGQAETKAEAVSATQPVVPQAEITPPLQAEIDPRQAEFNTRAQELLPIVVPLAKAGGELGQTLMPLLKKVQAQRSAGDFVGGLATVTLIEQLIEKLPSGSAAANPAQLPLSDTAAQFNLRFKALLPQIKGAAGSALGDAAKLKASEAGVFARQSDYPKANALLDEVERVLKQSTGVDGAPELIFADLFKARLAVLIPQIKQAAGTLIGDTVKLKASEAGVFARNQDFVQANLILDQIEAALQASVAANDDAAEWKRRVSALEPRVLEAQKTRAGESNWMTMFMTAQDLGNNGDFAKSLAIIENLERMLSAPANEKSPELAAAIKTWNDAREKAVGKLQETINVVLSTNHPEAGNSELELRAVLKQLNGNMETQKQAEEMRRYLAEDQVVADVAELVFDVKNPLLNVLSEITLMLEV